MSAIFIPIFIIIGALGAILVVFGRHLPDIVKGFKERKENKDASETPDPIDELPVNPRTYQLMQPQKSTFGGIISRAGDFSRVLIGKIIVGGAIAWKVIKIAVRMLANLFHRVPRFKPNIAVFNRENREVTGDDADLKNSETAAEVITTADIKKMPRNPLRYPEPAVANSSPKLKHPEKLKKEIVAENVESQVETIIENVREEKPKEAEIFSSAVVDKKPVFSVEKTSETRTRNRRRIVGKVAAKPTPLQELENTIMSEEIAQKEVYSVTDAEEVPEPAIPIEERKISFIDRETYALTDATQEISNQILEGKYSVAESALIDVLSKNPRNTEAYRLLGIVYLKRKDYEQAREVFEEALRRDPEHGGLHGPLGYCYMSVGEYGKALSMYQQAHNMDETNIEYLEQLLIISSRMDRRPLVNMTAKKILALNPNHADAKKYLARAVAR